MKILIVNTSDIQGGAARAAYRLHRALLAEGLDSNMLVQDKSSDDHTVEGPSSTFKNVIGKLRAMLESFLLRFYKNRTKTLFSIGCLPFSDIVERINALNPDVVHLHWISGGMIRIEDIVKIKAPIIWSLHDMWPFTGGCHYDEGCSAYENECGLCPVLYSSKTKDLSFKVQQRKLKSYSKIHKLYVIGLSRWLTESASASYLFKNRPIFNLPNPIDTTKFSPFDKQQARRALNLPFKKKLILFGAMSATSDPRKGFEELVEALNYVDFENTELVVFGSSKPKVSQGFKQVAHYLGRLHDDVSLRMLYSAADVMIVPSLQENLSNAIMESLACATPVVGFNIGGNSDLIEHQQNGYLAQPFVTKDLANGIEWVLDSLNYGQLCQNALSKVKLEFDSKIVAEKYIELYENVVKNNEI